MIFSVLVPFLPLPFMWHAIRRLTRIKIHGIPRRGEVTHVTTTDAHRTLRFRWTGRDGIPHESSTTFAIKALPEGDFSSGDALDLREDPANPARALWMPLLR